MGHCNHHYRNHSDEDELMCELIRAVNAHSANTAKWLGVIAEAIVHSQSGGDQVALDALRDKLRAQNDALESAVNAATD